MVECLEECDGRIDFVLDCIDTISTKIFIAEFAQKHGLALDKRQGAANKLRLNICVRPICMKP